jgi:hypothetical protein
LSSATSASTMMGPKINMPINAAFSTSTNQAPRPAPEPTEEIRRSPRTYSNKPAFAEK